RDYSPSRSTLTGRSPAGGGSSPTSNVSTLSASGRWRDAPQKETPGEDRALSAASRPEHAERPSARAAVYHYYDLRARRGGLPSAGDARWRAVSRAAPARPSGH